MATRVVQMFLIRQKYLLGSVKQIQCNTRTKHTSASTEDPIVVTDDGSTLVCWHPEKEFPYEFTKPMPDLPVKPSSVLKSSRSDTLMVLGKKTPEQDVREELAKLTYTCIHRWYPRSRDKRNRKVPKDRPYL